MDTVGALTISGMLGSDDQSQHGTRKWSAAVW
jgi:hypothetical protein